MAKREQPQPQGRTKLLTYNEAADQLAVHPRTVRAWADAGDLTKVELGPKSMRVTESSVEDFIAIRALGAATG